MGITAPMLALELKTILMFEVKLLIWLHKEIVLILDLYSAFWTERFLIQVCQEALFAEKGFAL